MRAIPQAESSDTLSLSLARLDHTAIRRAFRRPGIRPRPRPVAAALAAARRLRRALAGPGRGRQSRQIRRRFSAEQPVRSRRLVSGRSLVGPAVGPRARRGGSAAAPTAAPASGRVAATTVSRNSLATTLNGGIGISPHRPVVHPDVSPAFELETLDFNDGSVMVPGYNQLATPGGSVDLRAQVRDSATGTYTYTWNTSGLSDATSISGSSTYDLTFQWDTTIATATTESVSVTVTDPSLNVVSQTYTFSIPAGTGIGDRRDDLEQRHARPRPAPGRCTGLRQPERLGRREHRRARDVDQPAQLQPEYPGPFAPLRLAGGERPADHRGRARNLRHDHAVAGRRRS